MHKPVRDDHARNLRRRGAPFVASILAGLTMIATPAPAQVRIPGVPGVPEPDDAPPTLAAERLVTVRIAPDVAEIEPGATFHLAVIFEVEPDWHIYWTDPGVGGQPTEVIVSGPLGFKIGETRYPRPEVIPDPAGVSYGYHDEVALFVPITAPLTPMPGMRTAWFDVEIDYFVCRKRCLIGKTKRRVPIDLMDPRTLDPGFPRPAETKPDSIPHAKEIARHKAMLPRPLTELKGASAYIDQHGITPSLVVTGSSRRASEVSFLPISTPGVTCHGPDLEIDGERFVVRIPLEVRRQNALGKRILVRGLLTFGKTRDQPCYDVVVDLDARPLREELR